MVGQWVGQVDAKLRPPIVKRNEAVQAAVCAAAGAGSSVSKLPCATAGAGMIRAALKREWVNPHALGV